MKKIYTFWKGRVALYAILKSLGVGPGDVVLIPGYTCVVVPSAVHFLGAQVIYADVEAASYNVTQATLENAWRRHRGPRPKALIIQHTYGIPVEAEAILAWAKTENLPVIEDCAHVMGSHYRGTQCGELGEAAFFSSQWSKPVTTGLGGWAVVNSPPLAERLTQVYKDFDSPTFLESNLLRLQLYAHKLLFRPQLFWTLMDMYRTLGHAGLVIGSSSDQELALHQPQRYALRMSAFQEKQLEKALSRSSALIEHRMSIGAFYTDYLSRAGLPTPAIPDNSRAVLVRYPVLVDDKAAKLRLAQEKRLELGDWFVSPLHPWLENLEALGYHNGSCPVAEELCRHVINLPTHGRISLEEAKKIAEFVLNG